MNVIVTGGGRIGIYLALQFEKLGWEVALIKENKNDFSFAENFSGIEICGTPIDCDVLTQAGINNCHLLVAATDNDNINLMTSQIARELFRVPKILCRVDDPDRKEIFTRHFDITVICPTEAAVREFVSFSGGGI